LVLYHFHSVSAINFNKLVQQHFPEAPRSASYPSCSDPSKTSLYPPISCAITMKHSIKDVSAISSRQEASLPDQSPASTSNHDPKPSNFGNSHVGGAGGSGWCDGSARPSQREGVTMEKVGRQRCEGVSVNVAIPQFEE